MSIREALGDGNVPAPSVTTEESMEFTRAMNTLARPFLKRMFEAGGDARKRMFSLAVDDFVGTEQWLSWFAPVAKEMEIAPSAVPFAGLALLFANRVRKTSSDLRTDSGFERANELMTHAMFDQAMIRLMGNMSSDVGKQKKIAQSMFTVDALWSISNNRERVFTTHLVDMCRDVIFDAVDPGNQCLVTLRPQGVSIKTQEEFEIPKFNVAFRSTPDPKQTVRLHVALWGVKGPSVVVVDYQSRRDRPMQTLSFASDSRLDEFLKKARERPPAPDRKNMPMLFYAPPVLDTTSGFTAPMIFATPPPKQTNTILETHYVCIDVPLKFVKTVQFSLWGASSVDLIKNYDPDSVANAVFVEDTETANVFRDLKGVFHLDLDFVSGDSDDAKNWSFSREMQTLFPCVRDIGFGSALDGATLMEVDIAPTKDLIDDKTTFADLATNLVEALLKPSEQRRVPVRQFERRIAIETYAAWINWLVHAGRDKAFVNAVDDEHRLEVLSGGQSIGHRTRFRLPTLTEMDQHLQKRESIDLPDFSDDETEVIENDLVLNAIARGLASQFCVVLGVDVMPASVEEYAQTFVGKWSDDSFTFQNVSPEMRIRFAQRPWFGPQSGASTAPLINRMNFEIIQSIVQGIQHPTISSLVDDTILLDRHMQPKLRLLAVPSSVGLREDAEATAIAASVWRWWFDAIGDPRGDYQIASTDGEQLRAIPVPDGVILGNLFEKMIKAASDQSGFDAIRAFVNREVSAQLVRWGQTSEILTAVFLLGTEFSSSSPTDAIDFVRDRLRSLKIEIESEPSTKLVDLLAEALRRRNLTMRGRALRTIPTHILGDATNDIYTVVEDHDVFCTLVTILAWLLTPDVFSNFLYASDDTILEAIGAGMMGFAVTNHTELNAVQKLWTDAVEKPADATLIPFEAFAKNIKSLDEPVTPLDVKKRVATSAIRGAGTPVRKNLEEFVSIMTGTRITRPARAVEFKNSKDVFVFPWVET